MPPRHRWFRHETILVKKPRENPMALTTEQIRDYRKNGYLLVPAMFPAETMDRALREVDRITYGKPFSEWAATANPNTLAIGDGITGSSAPGRPQFPTGVAEVDKLIENPDYLNAIEQLLDTQDIHYCNAHLFVRAGPNDKRHSAHPWEGFHADHDTNSFLPPRSPAGEYDYLNTVVLLHDIGPEGAPITMIPGSHADLAEKMAEYLRAGWVTANNVIHDIRKIKAYDPSQFQFTIGRKGSVAFYSSYTVHAAAPFKDRTLQRSLWTLSAARRSTQAWTGFIPPPYRYGEREHHVPFWQSTTPRVRSMFGWPKPGHPYYSSRTLELLQATFPKMDLAPYQAALRE
jgi:hypothetical protein